MAFSFKVFLEDLAIIGPSLISGVLSLKNETGSVSKIQLANDSLNLATGVATALTSQDVGEQAEAQAAAQVTQAVINSVATATAKPATA